MDEIESNVLAMVRRIAGKRAELTSALYHDLPVAGDDAYELLSGISKKYGTSFEGFDFNTYFPNETSVLWYHFAELLGFKNNRFKKFTVSHLIEVVRRGHWFQPESLSDNK